MGNIDFKNIEEKWKQRYEGLDAFKGVDFDEKREKFYMLIEFPYPSGSGLHVGHAFSMTAADVYARFMRMKGKNVLFPMGWDAFGLPTENYAIKTGVKPQVATKANTDMFREQMKALGFSFDWEREVNTTLPNYYKWTQWIFTKLFEKGLAEKQEMPINWCPKDKTGLANEEVIDGKCERCGTQTERRTISQWVVKITDYADRLIDGLKDTDFIDKVKAAQINWIGKKEGVKIRFKLVGNEESVEVFTSRPDTLEGATFLVIAPEHKLVEGMVGNDEVADYVEKTKRKSEMERTDLAKDKSGVYSGMMAVNPLTGKEIQIWIGDYVLNTYGSGAIMAVPSHDERDGEFAKKYNLPIDWNFKLEEQMTEKIVSEGWGNKSNTYHLRDWIFSRQHYWGEPIPMVYCKTDGWVSVPREQLPVILPEMEKYQPTDNGESPLSSLTEWVKTVCPKCGGMARRETDTMPNWAGSDWYFLRYIDPANENEMASMEKMKYWLPVDVYVGGDEHNTLHLLYSRFIYQFLYDLGEVPSEIKEPYKKRVSHGVILGPDGNRMSKSKGNVILPEVVAGQFGVDALRTYLMFIGPFDATMAWNERALVGVQRFLEKIERLVMTKKDSDEKTDEKISILINRLIKEVGTDVENFKFNTAIAKTMEAMNEIGREGMKVEKNDLKKLVIVMAVFAPYLMEELWEQLGGAFSVHNQLWPEYDEAKLITNKVAISVQINGKLRAVVEVGNNDTEETVFELAKKEEKVAKYLAAGTLRKVIFVKGKAINFVVN